MWIYFTKTVYGTSHGGGLNNPFHYFGRIISDRFQSEKINFPFQEIEIGLLFPSSKITGKEYANWDKQLPHYYRGKNLVRIIFPLIEEEKNLTDVFQLIHKAFDIITSKKKKDDNYNSDKIKSTLLQLEKELELSNLFELNSKYETLFRQKTIEKQFQERTIRKQRNDEAKKLISDLRLYYWFPNNQNFFFSPYDNQICNRILEKLRQKKFRLPNYSHLYIMISDTFEDALYHAVRTENWFVYGIAVLENYVEYPTKSDAKKKQIVFKLIKQGLNDIAKIDKLDKETLNEVLDEVERDIN